MRPSLFRPMVLAAWFAAAAGCSDDSGTLASPEPPSATVTAASVVAGQTVPIRLENPSAVTWSYSMCGHAQLQRKDGDEWTTLPPPLDLCAPELSELPPGDIIDEELAVPLGTAAGTHRALLTFEQGGDEVERATNAFEVIGEIDGPTDESDAGSGA